MAEWQYHPDPLVDLLIIHQRNGLKGCLCGWSVLGASYAKHVATILRDAGLCSDA